MGRRVPVALPLPDKVSSAILYAPGHAGLGKKVAARNGCTAPGPAQVLRSGWYSLGNYVQEGTE